LSALKRLVWYSTGFVTLIWVTSFLYGIVCCGKKSSVTVSCGGVYVRWFEGAPDDLLLLRQYYFRNAQGIHLTPAIPKYKGDVGKMWSAVRTMGWFRSYLIKLSPSDPSVNPGGMGTPTNSIRVQHPAHDVFLIVPLWPAALVFLILVVARLVKRQNRDHSQCYECGYELHGNTSGVCPECGTAIPENQVNWLHSPAALKCSPKSPSH
jgi:ribosomal protein L37E